MASLINQQITLDLIPGPVVKTVSVSQYDTGTRTLQFKIQNDGVDFTIPSGITASIEATKKDLTGFSYPCTISGNTVSVVVQPQMTVFPGKTMCEIVFKQGNDRIGTANFWLKVEDAALNDSTIISETDIPGIANLSEAVQTAVESAESAEQDALDAEAWAVGTRDGVAVESTDPTYHNNSKYYSETFEGDVDRIEALVQQAEALAESIYSIGIVESASGDPATLSDGSNGVPMKSVSVDIDPVQDLHGYEYPWVGGAGKNLLPNTLSSGTQNGITYVVNSDGSVTCNGTATSNVYLNVTPISGVPFKAGTYVLNGCPSGGAQNKYIVYDNGSVIDTGNGATFTLSEDTNKRVVIRITSGQTVSNLVFKPMIRLSTVTDSTFAPYSNICPISGWDEVKVTRTGKNLFDPSGYGAYKTGENAYTATLTQINTIRFNIPRILLNREITFSAHVGSLGTGITGLRVQAIVGGTIYNGNSYNTGGSGYSKITFTPTSESDVVKFTYGSGGPSSVSFSDLQLEVGAERTDYEPYTTQTYPISLTSAGTVYGGTLDVVSGELVVDRKMANFDGTESWGTEVVQNVRSFYLLLSNANKMTDRKSGALYSDLLSNEFVGTNVTGAGQVYVSSGGYLNCRTNDNFTDVETWKSFLASNPLQVVYPLATPLTYTLTPTQITSLLGVNHIWADCGEVAVEYVADTKMYIQNLLASQG